MRNVGPSSAGHRARRRTLIAAVGAALVAPAALATQPRGVPFEVWKSPTCGCCKDWVTHMEAHGFVATIHDTGNGAARARLGMPSRLGSCHTALVGGYVIEGHVPAPDVLRLLRERPRAIGLAVPGMPIGSPGMDGPEYGNRRDAYDVLLVTANGNTSVFRRYAA